MGYKLAGEKPPEEIANIIYKKAARFHFELPGSTHGFKAETETGKELTCYISGSDERAVTGKCSLKLVVPSFREGVKLFYKTYYGSKDFSDSRYDPAFSPVFYTGQTISCNVSCDIEITKGLRASPYALDANSGRLIEGHSINVGSEFVPLSFTVPAMEGVCVSQVGVVFRAAAENGGGQLCAWIDDFDISGAPDYTIDFAKEHMDVWHGLHREVSQFTWLKGLWYLDGGVLNGSCADFGEAYTGDVSFRDYSFSATVIPQLGYWHGINFRVQGAVRSYALVLSGGNKLRLMKNSNAYRVLCETDFIWRHGASYRFTVKVCGNKLTAVYNGKELLNYMDNDLPYLNGAVGASVRDGSRCHYADFAVKDKRKLTLPA
jgi:hypothetical protein